jgi:PAS domain S-box-containing protein
VHEAGPDATEALGEDSAEELYEHAPAGYLSSRPDGTLVRVNETLLAWTGYARADLIGVRRLHDLLAPGARIYYETHYAPLLQLQGAVREIALELVCADGRRLPVLLSSVLRRDEAGAPRVVHTSVFDATDRRRYERELQRARAAAETRARAALALAHVGDGVLLVDADGRLDVLNPAGEAILGVEAETAAGRPMADLLPGWSAVASRIPVGPAAAPPAPVTLPLAAVRRERWLTVAGIDSGDGVVYTFRDVTAERRLDALRDELVATISHELRTPLTGIYGAASTLLGRYEALDDATRLRLLELIVDEGERLTRSLDELVLTSRLDAGDVVLADDVVDARRLLDDLVASLPGPARARVALDVAEGVRVRGDAAHLREALGHLLDNALAYSDGPVRVSASAGAAFARLAVADDGPGVPEDERDRIFDRFYRLDPSHLHGVTGLGLGLYVARELVGRMRGQLVLVSAAAPTTFAADVPLAEGARPE